MQAETLSVVSPLDDVEVMQQKNGQLLKGLSMEGYHKRPELSSSQLADFLDDRLQWYRVHVTKEWKKKKTSALERGSLTHEFIEEGMTVVLSGRMDELVRRVPAHVLNEQGHRKGKTYTDWTNDHPARVYLVGDEPNPFEHIMRNIDANRYLRDLLKHHDKEVTLVWVCPETGLSCRVRVDLLDRRFILDWKTCRELYWSKFAKEAERLHYVRRLAFYQMAVKWVFGEEDFRRVMVVAIKNCGGYAVQPYEIPPSWLKTARAEALETMRRISKFDIELELNRAVVTLPQPGFNNFPEDIVT